MRRWFHADAEWETNERRRSTYGRGRMRIVMRISQAGEDQVPAASNTGGGNRSAGERSPNENRKPWNWDTTTPSGS